MKRTHSQEIDTQGQDSFLDVVANMVGIMIILVTVVGVRAGKTIPAESVPSGEDDQQLAVLQSQALSLQRDIHQIHQQASQVGRQVALRGQERDRLATFAASVREELRTHREKLTAEQQGDLAMHSALATARLELERKRNEQAAVAAIPERITILNLPTPLSRTVHDREFHFQLRGGRIAPIPLDRLLEDFQAVARHKVWKLRDQNEMSDVVGPIGGFRLRYQLRKIDHHPTTPQDGPGGTMIELFRWELLPVSTDLGETVAEALLPNSHFHRAISGLDRQHATLTIWTYPDSFTAFRSLKAELHKLGFATAGRPLPEGEAIGGSPHGTRSAAQ